MRGLALLMVHPEIPTCSDCKTWLYGEDWKRSERPRGTPLRRPPHAPTPCWKCPKADDSRPSPHNELGDREYRMLEMYQRVKAGKTMPDDALVEWYCGLFRWVEDQVERAQSSMASVLAAMLGTGKTKGASRGRP